MKSPKWLSLAIVMAIHDEAIYYFGGSGGVRDAALLESALDRPRNRLAYAPAATIFELAASLGAGLARNHAFVDGNKRTALLATRAFLYLNKVVLEPEEHDEVLVMVGVATGEVSEADFAAWLEASSKGSPAKRARAPRRRRPRF